MMPDFHPFVTSRGAAHSDGYSSLSLFAQNEMESTTVISPSPEATALGSYGDIPVSMFTGISGIRVPLHNGTWVNSNLGNRSMFNDSNPAYSRVNVSGLATGTYSAIYPYSNDGCTWIASVPFALFVDSCLSDTGDVHASG